MNNSNEIEITKKIPDIWKMNDSTFYKEIIKPLSFKTIKNINKGYKTIELDKGLKLSKNQKKEILSRINKYKDNLKYGFSNDGLTITMLLSIIAIFIPATFGFFSSYKSYSVTIDEINTQIDKVRENTSKIEYNPINEINNIYEKTKKYQSIFDEEYKYYILIFLLIISILVLFSGLIINYLVKKRLIEKIELVLKQK